MALLEVEALRTVFHTEAGEVPAVDGVSFTLEAGEVLGLVGESGSGKSVTAFSLMRLIQPPGEVSAQAVRLAGTDLTRLDARAMRRVRGRQISMIFQEPLSSLNPVHSIGAQVMEPLLIHTGIGRAEARARALAMLKRVGIPDAEARFGAYPHQLSGGLRQRVMIALALVGAPKILIADEPTTALDVTIQAQILELLKDLQAELGMAIIMITHDLGVIAEIADRVAVMYAGQIVETAPVAEIFARTAHPYTAALIGSIPDREVEVPRLKAIEGTIPGPFEMPEGCRFAPRCAHAVAACRAAPPPLAPLAPGHQTACLRVLAGELPDLAGGGA
jgi:peptide/nickel transport system ATP-binding protein/oligopeptide transport system ATP-binding protein